MQVMENGPSHTMASAGGDEPNSTKARLNGILESFQAFDSDMKTGTRVRRENDEHRIAQLTAELTRLEKTLNQEIKRRVEMNKSVQVWGESEVEKMSEQLQSMVIARSDSIAGRLDDIVGKIDALEDKFDVEMAKIPVDIKQRGEELHKMLTDFESKFEAERMSRLEREGRILKQLADHEQEVATDFETERTSRENTYADLRRILDENVRSRMKGDEKFQSFVREELADLKNAVSLERQTRERDDGEIVDALNRYTSKLQSSLKIINSSEI
ncbi:unnamed protein product [Ectocarpus sp. 6 AP-2014]